MAISTLKAITDKMQWNEPITQGLVKIQKGWKTVLTEDLEWNAADWNSGHLKYNRLPKGAVVLILDAHYLASQGIYGHESGTLRGVWSDRKSEVFYK